MSRPNDDYDPGAEQAPLLPLADDEVHLWHVDPDAVPSALLARYRGLLSADESGRYFRFRVEDARRQFLVTRALVRTTLSHYLGGDPLAWRFETNRYGRPDVILPTSERPLKFNVSHSHGRVVCALAWERELGVDVEFLDRRGGGMHLARRFFSRREADDLEALPEDRQRSGFFDYWTLKEAYIKAHGKGLAIPLDQFTFLLRPGEPISVECDPCLADDPASWQFLQFDLSPWHRLALAVRRSSGQDARLVLHTAVPLAGG